MKKLFLSVFLFILFFSSQAHAYTQQVILGSVQNDGGSSTLINTGTNYYALASVFPGVNSSLLYEQYVPWADAGTFTHLIVNLGAAPSGSGNGYTFAIYKNGSVTALATGAILNNATQGVDLSDAVTVAAGDLICLQVTVSGSPTAVYASWSLIFTPTTAGQTVLFGGQAIPGASGTVIDGTFAGNQGAFADSAGNRLRQEIVIPCAGKIEDLYVATGTAEGGGVTVKFTVEHNGVDSTVTTSLSGAAQVTNSDITHSFTVSAGDTIYMLIDTTAGTPPGSNYSDFSVVFIPNTPGDFILPMSDSNQSLSNATLYEPMTQRAVQNTTESKVRVISNPFQVQAIYVLMQTASGAGQSYTFNFRDNAVSPSGANVVLSNVTSNHTTGLNYQVKYEDLIDTQSVGTATATAQGTLSISYLGYVPPHGSEFFGFYNGG